MGLVDGLIVLGVLFFMILGFRDGIIKKIYGIVGFWAGLLVATECMYIVGQKLIDLLGFSKEISHILAFCGVFLVVVLLENLFWRWFGQAREDVLSMMQRFGGAIIGFIQGLVAVSLFLIMFAIVDLPPQESRSKSSLYAPVFHIAPTAYDFSTSIFGSGKGFLDVLRDNFKGIKLP
jgi:membrane protein required for colicin V production